MSRLIPKAPKAPKGLQWFTAMNGLDVIWLAEVSLEAARERLAAAGRNAGFYLWPGYICDMNEWHKLAVVARQQTIKEKR